MAKKIKTAENAQVDAGAANPDVPPETAPVEKKPRKTREKGPVAPKRKDNPAGYQLHHFSRAVAVIRKVDEQTVNWGVEGMPQHFTDALASLSLISVALAGVPADFKAPRKNSAGGGRPQKQFTIGQRVLLSPPALARVKEFFPDVDSDCHFALATTCKPEDKLLAIVCTGVGGTLAPFYCTREARKELTPFGQHSSLA